MHTPCYVWFVVTSRHLLQLSSHHEFIFLFSSQISQAARDHKKFADYNERCAVHEKSKAFAERLYHLVKGISDSVPIKILSFLSDACQLLIQCHKVDMYMSVSVASSRLSVFLCQVTAHCCYLLDHSLKLNLLTSNKLVLYKCILKSLSCLLPDIELLLCG